MVVLKSSQSQHRDTILMTLTFMHLLNLALRVRPGRLRLNDQQNKADLGYLMNPKWFPPSICWTAAYFCKLENGSLIAGRLTIPSDTKQVRSKLQFLLNRADLIILIISRVVLSSFICFKGTCGFKTLFLFPHCVPVFSQYYRTVLFRLDLITLCDSSKRRKKTGSTSRFVVPSQLPTLIRWAIQTTGNRTLCEARLRLF